MKRKILAMTGAFVLMAGMAATAFASPAPGAGNGACGGMGCGAGTGLCGEAGAGGMMWDADGNFLDRDAFEAKLDQWIEDGVIDAADKDACLAQYDYCAQYGGGSAGARGGMGRGRGMGRGC